MPIERILLRFLRWLVNTVVVLFGVSLLAFVLTYLTPGDLAENMLTSQGVQPTAEMVEMMREHLGLNRPLSQQYLDWMWRLLHGDLGTSLSNGTQITHDLLTRLPLTLALTISSLTLTWLVAVPLGLVAALHPRSILDSICRVLSYVSSAMPAFLVALLVLHLLGLKAHLFPIAASQDLYGMVMPTLTLAVAKVGWYFRQIRAISLEQADQAYVAGLRIRGMGSGRIGLHLFRNIAAPLATLAATSFGAMLAGSAVVEQIFGWHGIGQYALSAISAKDYPVIQAYVVWCALVFLIANTAADLLAFFLDPRLSEVQGGHRVRAAGSPVEEEPVILKINHPDLAGIVSQAPRVGGGHRWRIRPALAWRILLGLLALVLVIGVFAGFITPHDAYETDVTVARHAPGADFWMGTDILGRDVFSRVLLGIWPTLSIALTVVACSLVIGTIIGVISALAGGAADAVIQRLTAVFQSFPEFILALAFAAMLGPGFVSVVTALTLASWTGTARYARILTMQVKRAPFIQAARMNAVPGWKIFLGHIVPNIASPLFVMAASGLGSVILNLATLSFVGLGMPQPTSEWGTMISEGRSNLQVAPWLVFGPGLALFLVILIVNLFADTSQELLAVSADQSRDIELSETGPTTHAETPAGKANP